MPYSPEWRISVSQAGQALTQSLRHSFLIALTVVYLLGQVGAAWGWVVWSPLWLWGFALLTIGAWIAAGRTLAVQIGSLLLAFVLANVALHRGLTPHFPPEHLRHLSLPQQLMLEGQLFREPERFPQRGRLHLEVTQAWQAGAPRPASGKVLITVRSLARPWRYGDVVRLSLRLRTPRNFHTPGSFDYENYLARQDIYLSAFLWDDSAIEHISVAGHRVRSAIEQTRRTIGAFFDMHLDPRSAAVLRALIIGDQSGLGTDLRDAFTRAGVAHVLSISGLHIALVAAAAYGAWWWLLGRSRYLLLAYPMPKLAALLTFPPVLGYASLAGGNVATWRSVVMVLVYLLAILLDRQQEVYRSLALAALIISLLWPGSVLDISFQLSFLSVLAIFLGMAWFSQWWATFSERRLWRLHPRREQVFRWGATYVAVSVFALIGTAPATAAYFNQISLAGLFANLVIIPLLGSAAVILGLVAAGLLFLHTVLATPVLLCAGLVTRIGIWLVELIAALPAAALDVVTPTLWELSLFYGLLCCLVIQVQSPKPKVQGPALPIPVPQPLSPMKYLLPILTCLLVADIAVWTWRRYFDHDLRVTFLDVGQGDAAVVELPGSPVMVIDGGGFASADFDAGEAIVAPFLWSRKIGRVDIVVMSHPQLDHYGGLAFIAERFRPREFWFNGEHTKNERFVRLMTTLKRAGVILRILCRDTPPMPLAGVSAQILHPPCHHGELETNDASLVLRLTHGEIDVLFTGDIEALGEQTLLAHNSALTSEILKVPHHGSRTSSTSAFVQVASPQVAVASLGFHNRFRFPAPEVVQRYEAQGSRFLRTDQEGTVTVVSNGNRYSVETELPLRIRMPADATPR